MKKLVFPVLMILTFMACQKSQVNPASQITIPDGASFKLQMATDSIGYNYPSNDTANVLVHFNHTYHLDYSFYNGEDIGANEFQFDAGWYFTALSHDGGQLVTDGVPYKPGVAIPLFITSGASTTHEQHFILQAFDQTNIPANMHIWVKDNQLKDSADIRSQPFRFYIHRLDTNSYGGNRLQIVVEPY
ncbi:MAG: hypothetical protein ABI203_04315 [Mucilaginibacter sp.]